MSKCDAVGGVCGSARAGIRPELLSGPQSKAVLGLLYYLRLVLLKERKVFFNYSVYTSELLLSQSLFWLWQLKKSISKV